MKKILQGLLYGLTMSLLFFASCKKDRQEGALSGSVSNFKYSVNGTSAKLSWDPFPTNFDQYELQISKSEDFSVVDLAIQLDRSATDHTFYKLSPSEMMYSRIRALRTASNEQSEWKVVTFSTDLNNVLSPISETDVSATEVILRWSLGDNVSAGASSTLTKITIKPTIGSVREYQLTPAHLKDQSITVSGIVADMKYTVTIYDGRFARGVREFTTLAIPVNGVWTLSPYSNLKSAIAKCSDGDKILLRAGVYDLSDEDIIIGDKSVTIQALSAEAKDRPKLYARGFELGGNERSMSFIGLDISGARVDVYKTELADLPDHQWNNRLLTINASSQGFDKAVFQNCIIRNYLTGVFSINDNNRVPHKKGNAVIIENCIIKQTGADNSACVIEINAGELKIATISNSTFDSANKMLMKIDAEKNTANNVIDFKLINNTINNCWSAGAVDFKALKSPATCTIENNIFSNIACIGNFFANFAFTANNFHKKLINTNFYKVTSKATIYGSNQNNQPVHSWELRHPNTRWNEVQPNFIMNDASHANPNSIKEYPVDFDPGYKNEPEGDFTVSPSSPLRTLDGGQPVGDPRWW